MTMHQLGKYIIIEKLGENALGVVYKAYDEVPTRPVAIRVLREDVRWDADLKLRFHRECRAAAGLHHPHIAAIHEIGEEGNLTYIVMEFLEGKDLRTLIQKKAAVPIETKLSIVIQVADALDHAHTNGIIHGHIRPSQIRLTPSATVKIKDFGIASLLLNLTSAVQTETSIYLAPEQIQGNESGPRSDTFSAGIVFYELLTYAHPFHDKDSILSQTHLPAVEQFPDAPLGVWPILENCLAKDPDDRYKSMADFGNACRELLGDLAEAAQLMLEELKTKMHLLKQAAERPESPFKLAKLVRDVENLLKNDKKTDYSSVQRLMATFEEQYSAIQSLCEAPRQVSPRVEQTKPMIIPSTTQSESVHRGLSSEGAQKRISPQPSRPLATLPAAINGKDANAERSAEVPPVSPSPRPTEIDGSKGQSLTEQLVGGTRPEKTQSGIDSTRAETSQLTDSGDLNQSSDRAQHVSEILSKKASAWDLSRAIDYAQEEPTKRFESPPFLPEREHNAHEQDPAKPVEDDPPVLNLDAASTEAKSMPEQIEKNEDAGGTEKKKDIEAAGYSAFGIDLMDQTAVAPDSASYRGGIPKVSLWISAGILALTAITGFWLRSRSSPQPAGTIPSSQEIQAVSRGKAEVKPLLGETQREKRQVTVDVLLKEARILAAEGRREECRILIQRILELRPVYQPAMALLAQVEAESSKRIKEKQEKAVRKWLTNASALIKAGNLEKAKTEIDKVQRLRPNLPEALALLRRWETKNSEFSRHQARVKEEQAEAARRQTEERTGQIQEFYRQGKYNEAQSSLDRWLAENPESSQAQALRIRTTEVQRSVKAYEVAMTGKKYDEALSALAKVGQINPAHPNLAEFRNAVESKKAAATASLTVYRLGAPATLTLDGQPFGTDGEIENKSIPVGTHSVAITNTRGLQAAKTYDFSDDQSVAYVYDVSSLVLRLMTEADRELLTQRRTMEQVHHFQVEHSHGVFRGKCAGELTLSYFDVEYKPVAGVHGFRMPFRSLDLTIDGEKIDLLYATDNKDFRTFKAQDTSKAKTLKQLWDKLESLGK